ncbi:small integral membrane protein 24-like, partial [Plectropomus leopardus]
MRKLCALISCLLLSVGAVTAQAAQTQPERLLPQWLTGIIAVVAFLFLTFVALLVKKSWCDESRRKSSVESVREDELVMTNENTYETTLDTVRKKSSMESVREMTNENTYETTLDMV